MKHIKLIITSIVLILLAVFTVATLKTEDKPIVVSTFGLATTQMKKDVLNPFTKQTGVATRTQFGDSAPRLVQVEHNKHSGIDVIELSQSNTQTAADKKILKKLDFAKLHNFKYLTSEQQQLARDTNGIPYTVNSIGIIYNPKTCGQLTEWNQLWNHRFRHRIAIPEITTTFGPAVLYLAGEHAGVPVTKDDGHAAFQSLARLKPNVVKTYTQSSDLTNMFKTGEIDAAIVGDFAVSMIQLSNPNLKYQVPMSGTYANYNTVSILKNSQHEKTAYKYLDFRISNAIQTRVASTTSQNSAPVNSSVHLSSINSRNKTYGKVAQRARIINYSYVNSHLSEWINRWNKLMN